MQDGDYPIAAGMVWERSLSRLAGRFPERPETSGTDYAAVSVEKTGLL